MADIRHIGELQPDRRNARRHNPRNIGMIVDALHEVGPGRSIVIDEDNNILAGNGTWEAAAQAGIEKVQIIERDPEAITAVRVRGLSKRAKKRLALFDNRTAELAEWEPEVLAEDKDALDGMFTSQELDDLLASIGADEEPADDPGAQVDRAAELQEKWQTERGQLWQIGRHRLLCGDSTSADDVARLMGGERAQACVTDPPYGQNREGITNDDPEGLRELYDGCLSSLPVDNGIVIAFQSPRLFPEWIDAVRSYGQKFERALWFYDETDVTFPWRGWLMTSQIALVSSVGKPKWNDAGPYHHDCYLVKTAGKQNDAEGHTTAKPLDVVVDLVEHTTGLLYEPFNGSGTTMVAAEQTGRTCYGMEIEPKYIAVALERMAGMGLEPRLIDG